MRILAFNSPQGFFHFQLEDIESQAHAHPAHEIIIAKQGHFSLQTSLKEYQELTFACVSAHITHGIKSSSGEFEIIMLEASDDFWQERLKDAGIFLTKGIYVAKTREHTTALSSMSFPMPSIPQSNHPIIETCLAYFAQKPGLYEDMVVDLQDKTHLSASRLSHLFKAEMGISLKKYAVWNRLKYAFRLLLEGRENTLTGIALESGFFDSAHMSRAFKQMLGMSPSEQYNSRMIQD